MAYELNLRPAVQHTLHIYANADFKAMQSQFNAYDRGKLSSLICASIPSLTTFVAVQSDQFLANVWFKY